MHGHALSLNQKDIFCYESKNAIQSVLANLLKSASSKKMSDNRYQWLVLRQTDLWGW